MLISSYSCCGRSWMSVLSEAVENGLLTDKDVRYPRLGDYHSWDELSQENAERWRDGLAIRLEKAGWKLVELPAPGCCMHPGEGDAWALAHAGDADNDKLASLSAEYRKKAEDFFLYSSAQR